MNDAKLILDIGADVSQFEASLGEVRNRIKEITKEIESASGTKLAELNFKLTGLERTEDTLMRFGQFAEGTLGALKNDLARLKQERLEIKTGNISALEEYNRKIQETTENIKRLESVGQNKVENIIPQPAIDSIEYFKDLINQLRNQRAKISVNTTEAEENVKAINKQISIYKNNISNIENLGKIEEVIDPNSIQGLRKQLADLENIRIRVNVNGEAELALLNTQIADIQGKIEKANSLTFDPKGEITNGAAKARQSITNLGLVLQDLPFGFIAIQNNIPNLIQSFAALQQEAKGLGVTTGSLLRQQFQGTAGTILGLGLAVSAVTSLITYAIQEYGSLGAALDALTGRSVSLKELNRQLSDSFIDVNKNTAGEIANLQSLVNIVTNVNSTKAQQLSAQKKINDEYPALLAFIKDENLTTEESIKLIGERLKLIAQQIKLQGRSEALIKLIGESAVEGEKALKRIFDFNKGDLSFIDDFSTSLRGLFTGLPGAAGQIKVLTSDFNNAAKETQFFTNQLDQNNAALAEVDGLIKQIEESLDKSLKKQRELDKAEEDAARKRLKALEDYKKALEAFNQLKVEVPKLLDDKKVIEDKINTLKKYGDILLNTNKYDFERADALNRIVAIDKEYFKNLNIEKMTLEQVKVALDKYVQSLVDLQNIPKVNFGGLFDNLGKSIEVFTKDTRIPTLFDKVFKGNEFDKITDGVKNFTERTGITFEKFRQDIINKLVLTQAQQGFALSLEQIQAILAENVKGLNQKVSELKLQDFLSGPAAEAQAKKSKKFFDTILKNAEEFQKTVESNLQKPFRDFFDLIIEEGKISFDSFFELFKDLIKRIASQLIASGIAKILTTALFPTAAVTDSPLQKVIKLLSGGAGFFKTALPKSGVNNVNLGGVAGGGLQLAGEVVFVQRGSDLIGAINRTNATINRVG